MAMKLVEGARVVVLEVRNEGRAESVVVANEGHADQPLTGWALASFKGVKVFRFEDGLVLLPGGKLVVMSGEGVSHNPPAVFAWTDETVWNNRGDVAVIFDCDGEEVSRYAYPASVATQARRLPKHRLVAGPDGSYAIIPTRRAPPRERRKVSRTGTSRG
jgi:hypothetical protein